MLICRLHTTRRKKREKEPMVLWQGSQQRTGGGFWRADGRREEKN